MNAGEAQTRLFSVEIPADAKYVRVARLFAAAVARHFECPEESIADVKLAVSEAATAGIEQQAGPVRVDVERADGGLVVSVTPAGGSSPDTADAASGDGLGMTMIRAIFEDARIADAPGGRTVLRFSVPLGEEELRPELLPP